MSLESIFNLVMHQNIFIIGGTGKVGRELLRQIAENDVLELKRHTNPTVVLGVSNSKEFVFSTKGFSADLLKKISTGQLALNDLNEADVYSSDPQKITSILDEHGFGGDVIFVDTTAAKESMRDMHLNLIQSTDYKVVTANKNPISLYEYETYFELTKDPNRYRYSGTAIAGLGAVPWISERRAIGDQIHQINASLSGTLGFITAQLDEGKMLSEVIVEADEKGFTEPDFRDDLNGLDVARKLIILAREAGHAVVMGDVEIERFLPDEYFEIEDAGECLNQIKDNYDAEMKRRNQEAKAKGQTLKYLASFSLKNGQLQLKVGFKSVSLDSAFGQMKGTANRIEVITDIYNETSPYKLEGPGAGLECTASVLRTDLLKMQSSVSRIAAK